MITHTNLEYRNIMMTYNCQKEHLLQRSKNLKNFIAGPTVVPLSTNTQTVVMDPVFTTITNRTSSYLLSLPLYREQQFSRFKFTSTQSPLCITQSFDTRKMYIQQTVHNSYNTNHHRYQDRCVINQFTIHITRSNSLDSVSTFLKQPL